MTRRVLPHLAPSKTTKERVPQLAALKKSGKGRFPQPCHVENGVNMTRRETLPCHVENGQQGDTEHEKHAQMDVFAVSSVDIVLQLIWAPRVVSRVNK
jgi:hypothetical protein